MPARHLFRLLLFCLPLPLWGQELPRVLNFSKTVYAGQNQNWAIAQTPSGTMFFANNGGLLEYDGSRWRMLNLPGGQTVRSVACREGKVFVGGFAEFGYFEADAQSKWRYRSLSANLQSDKAGREEIWHILASSASGNIFFQSFSAIYKFDGEKTVQIDPPGNIMFLQEAGEDMVFQVIGQGLFRMAPRGAFSFVQGSEALAGAIVAFIVPQEDGSLLAGTKNEGLFSCKDGRCIPWPNPLNERLKTIQPNKAARLSDGGLAIGTVLNGVFILDSLQHLRFHIHQENGLQNNTVLSMHNDHSGNLWLGLDKGIDLVELNSPLSWFADRSGKIGAVYTAALHNGNLYLGTNHGVFFKRGSLPVDKNESQWDVRAAIDQKFSLVPGTQGQVWQLQVFDNQLLCGHNDGTFIIMPNAAKKISDITGGWITLTLPGRTDALLQGTYTGLVVFEKNPAGEWAFSHRVEGFSEPVKKMAFDGNGSLWLAHSNRGLWRIRLSEDYSHIIEIRRFTKDDGLPSEMRLHLYERDESLRIQSDSSVFEVRNDSLVPLPPFEPSSKIFSFSFGRTFTVRPDNVVFAAHNSMSQFPLSLVPDNENIVGLTETVFLFCLENGYALWDSRQSTGYKNSFQNEPAISAVEVLSDPPQWYYPGKTGDIWKTAARKNNLRIHFTQPYFTQHVPLRWVLRGEEEHSATSRRDFAELTSLPPGDYSLEIFLMDDVAADRFDFSVLPPWWQTWWAMLIWTALATSVIWLVEKYNRRRLLRQREHLQKEKERELTAQRHEAHRERLQTEVDNKTRELSNATINLIRKNEILLSLKAELEKVELPRREHGRLDRLIENHLSGDQDWEMFEEAFNQVHDEFFKKLKTRFSSLTPGDLRLAAFLKLNLSSKEIASLLGISVRGVENKRYRLRKKMELDEVANLTEFMMKI